MSNLPWIYLVPIFFLSLYFILKKKKINLVKITDDDRKILNDKVSFYQRLDSGDKSKFESKIAAFLGSIKIEGVELDITALDEMLIASSAIIPIFGFEDWKYKNLTAVLLYPDTFNAEFQFNNSKDLESVGQVLGGKRNIMGMVGSGFMNGQMILSRAALTHGFANAVDAENTGIHEFVHLLDKSDGAADGIPENLLAHRYTLPWLKMMHEEMGKIAHNKSDINPYASVNEAEFFAVVSEYFFERPDKLKEKHPEIYEQLALIFAQDPAA
ncbi:Mlc titration factor MtfA (ptsG expression regulator) [Pedobacter sp. UYP30]|uniref:M90 family metallopeptidase n=1 Tax=Pedobacter sp. UYP30 TaxID=1756400 RepID=UPI0033988BF3